MSYDPQITPLSADQIEYKKEADAEYKKRLDEFYQEKQKNNPDMFSRIYNKGIYGIGVTKNLGSELKADHKEDDFVSLEWLAIQSGYDEVINFLDKNLDFKNLQFYTKKYEFYDKVETPPPHTLENKEIYQTYFIKVTDAAGIEIQDGPGRMEGTLSDLYMKTRLNREYIKKLRDKGVRVGF